MADVNPPAGDRSGHRESGGDRGQLLLVGALALAVLFVALALLLNTAIYTGNLATRDAGVDAAPAIEYASDSRAAGVDAVRSVNYRDNTSEADLNAAFRATVDRWDGLAAHHRAVAGDVAAVEVATVTNGTRIQQDNASRDFTNESGGANWTVASGAELSGVRSMRFTVDESKLGDPSDAFHVDVTAGGTTRSLYVYDDGGEVAVRVLEDGSEVASRSFEPRADGTLVIDVSNGSVNGTSYPELRTVIDVGDDTEIEYWYGNMAGGTYTMVIDDDAANDASLSTPGAGEPYATPAIYGATFDVTYRTSDLDYEAQIEVKPE